MVPSEPLWIDTTAELSRLVRDLPPGSVALDLEADSFHHYREKICLLQVCASGLLALVDPLAGVDLAPLGPILSDASRPKVHHAGDYDLRVLRRDFGLEERGLFDTMIAARLVGERAFGLGSLVEGTFGVKLDKSHQRADWSQRPLPPEMRSYAADDVRYLLPLAETLRARLVALGRWEWAQEEFLRVEAVRWTAEANDPEAYRKVKGAADLDRRGLAVLRELFLVRDREARARDVPPFKVLRDEALVAVTSARARTPAEIDALGHLPRRYRGEQASVLLEAVERGSRLPEAELPEPRATRRRRPDPAFESRVRELCKRRDQLAADLGLEPSVLAPRGLLEALVLRSLSGESVDATPGLRAWQARILLPILA